MIVDGQARAVEVGDEPIEVGEAGRGLVRAVLVGAQHAEEAPDLGERRTARRRDGFERLLGLGRVLVDHVRAHAGLYRDHAHGVRDHVVQLLRDAEALVGDRALRFFVALAFEVGGALFELFVVETAVAHARTDGVRRRVERTAQHEIGAACVRDADDRPTMSNPAPIAPRPMTRFGPLAHAPSVYA